MTSTENTKPANPPAAWLEALGWRETRSPRVMVFIAHPDDETIGLGGQLSALPGATIVHATDGAPRDLRFARELGFADAGEYARARRRELAAAMALVGVGEDALLGFNYSDQDGSHNLVEMTQRWRKLLAERRPDIVFTQAYEGGHPDHDAVAFAARAAQRLDGAAGAPLLIEMPFYHLEHGEPARQSFAPGGEAPVVVALSPQARAAKRAMYACHASQGQTLDLFHCDFECFRPSRPLDFSAPPNGGAIMYETFGWDIRNADCLERARAALAELGLDAWI